MLMESKDLWVELKPDSPSRMILRGTYGHQVNRAFRMTRQGLRWRFWRVLNDIYVSAFESIVFIERTFGTQLRKYAIRISKERYALRQEIMQGGFESADVMAKRLRADRSSAGSEPKPPSAGRSRQQ
jgi:hypothetical protein